MPFFRPKQIDRNEAQDPLRRHQDQLRPNDSRQAFALEALVESYHKPIIGFMYRLVYDAGIAEELAQEVLLQVYRLREVNPCPDALATRLYRVAVAVVLRYLRSRHVDVNLNGDGDTLRHGDDERVAAIQQSLSRLPERHRLAIIMHKYQRLDCQHIAAILQMSDSETKSLLCEGYRDLRKNLRTFPDSS